VADNRRSSTRHAVTLTGQLALNGEARQVSLINLSLGGALVSATAKISMGSRVVFSFNIPNAPDAIEVGATVRWSDDKTTGLQFDGLRARDVWALNKFFQQLPPSS
jgi:hypothetical protein